MKKDKGQMKQLMRELEQNSISMNKFLSYYCGISGESLKDSKISHTDIKGLMPDLKRVSFDYVLKNKSELYTGNILAVMDFYNHVVPYRTPVISKNDDFVTVEVIEDKRQSIIRNAILSENLNTYELSILCKTYKQLGKMREYRIAVNLLRNKKDLKVKQYKKQKELLKVKGREL